MAAGLVELKVTLVDGDGDGATDTLELGSLFKFEDDGPFVSGTLNEFVEEDDLANLQGLGNNEDLSVNAHIVTGSVATASAALCSPAPISRERSPQRQLHRAPCAELTSHNVALSYQILGDTLIATANDLEMSSSASSSNRTAASPSR